MIKNHLFVGLLLAGCLLSPLCTGSEKGGLAPHKEGEAKERDAWNKDTNFVALSRYETERIIYYSAFTNEGKHLAVQYDKRTTTYKLFNYVIKESVSKEKYIEVPFPSLGSEDPRQRYARFELLYRVKQEQTGK